MDALSYVRQYGYIRLWQARIAEKGFEPSHVTVRQPSAGRALTREINPSHSANRTAIALKRSRLARA